jgi:hypothetical protein
MFGEALQGAAAVAGGEGLGVPQEGLADAPARERVQDVDAHRGVLEVFLLRQPDPGGRRHAAVQPHEEEPELRVVIVAPRLEPGTPRHGAVKVPPGLEHQGIDQIAEFEEFCGVRRIEGSRQNQRLYAVRSRRHGISLAARASTLQSPAAPRRVR